MDCKESIKRQLKHNYQSQLQIVDAKIQQAMADNKNNGDDVANSHASTLANNKRDKVDIDTSIKIENIDSNSNICHKSNDNHSKN